MVEIHTKLCFGHFYSLEYQSIAKQKYSRNKQNQQKKVKKKEKAPKQLMK